MQVNEQIKQWRLAQKLSLEKAAAKIGVTSSSLRRWESGNTPSSLGMVALTKAGIVKQ